MFKTASQDRQTTAALQATFLGSLFGDSTCHASAAGSTSVAQPIAASDSQSIESHIPWPESGHPVSDTTGQNIDFSDFESWLSAFESSTILDAHNLDYSTSGHVDKMEVELNDANLPSMANTDWDAVRDAKSHP
jgi:hypothetical protein